MRPLRQVVLLCAAGAGLLFMAAPALSQEEAAIVITAPRFPHGNELATQTVKIGDLNLATVAGQAELEKRVTEAINQICPSAPGNVPHYQRKDVKTCRDFAWSHARPQMKDAIAAATQSAP